MKLEELRRLEKAKTKALRGLGRQGNPIAVYSILHEFESAIIRHADALLDVCVEAFDYAANKHDHKNCPVGNCNIGPLVIAIAALEEIK